MNYLKYLALGLFLQSALPAQNNAIGLQLTNRSGAYGVNCGPFSCVPVSATALVGSNVLTIQAFPQSPAILALSALPSSCVRIPGLGQRFALGPVFFVRAAFTTGPGRFCTGVHAQGALPCPLQIPSTLRGARFLAQALGRTCTRTSCSFAFSRPLLITVR